MGARRVREGLFGRGGGFSLPELLAVLALIALAIAIGIPIVNEQVRMAEVRAAADNLAVHLRKARMMSVTKHKAIIFKVHADPANSFGYDGINLDNLDISMPDRVKITTASDGTITFMPNGSVSIASTVVLESQVSGSLERWTANVSTMGMATLVHERVN